MSLGSPRVQLPEEVDIAIVGGGIMGLGLAYNLAKINARGQSKLSIAVIERSYLVSGASGRNGGGLRMQWADAENVTMMMESIDICRGLAQELGINLWFRQGGYLIIARSEAASRRLYRNVDLHRELGAPTRLLSPADARALVPHLNPAMVEVATYNPNDAVVFPWPFVWGYAARAIEGGVVVRTHTDVRQLTPIAKGYELMLSTGERLRASRVVNATGAWSNKLHRELGVQLPNHPHRHEILSSEPLRPFLDPLIVDLDSGLYLSQSTRGELVTGISLPELQGYHDRSLSMHSSLRFLTVIGARLTALMPITRSLKVLRQWSGLYDVSPDGDAYVGPTPQHANLIQLCGFTGHGFMMAPAVTRRLARWLALDESQPMLRRWNPNRSQHSGPRKEDMIIG
ncbi:MAG TPA: FAD-binding oxidoreductase [Nannocystis exedens]|nr:FAD-binding oxidoreductase [Nannocystis exedens]